MLTKKDFWYILTITILFIILIAQSHISSVRIEQSKEEILKSKGRYDELEAQMRLNELNLISLLEQKDSVLNHLKTIDRTKIIYKYEKINNSILELPLDSSVILLTKNLQR